MRLSSATGSSFGSSSPVRPLTTSAILDLSLLLLDFLDFSLLLLFGDLELFKCRTLSFPALIGASKASTNATDARVKIANTCILLERNMVDTQLTKVVQVRSKWLCQKLHN